MDTPTHSPFLRHCWLPFRVTATADGEPFVLHMRSSTHAISLTVKGRHAVRWITRGRETRWEEMKGAVNLTPCDGEQHTFVTVASADFESSVFLVPEDHFARLLAEEGVEPPSAYGSMPVRDDPVLQDCMRRLSGDAAIDGAADGSQADEAARRLVLRLAELAGGGVPDWYADAGTFDERTVERLVAHVDEHLRIAPSLADMAALVGLSPGHFARKFRQSMGLSFHRFVTRRRVVRSLETLRTAEGSIADLGLELGFASQSHFTRIFSQSTGMTPAKYRKRFRRVVG